jgi:hypothetical protein
MAMAGRFDVGSAQNVVLGIGKASPALFVSSRERPAVGFMAGYLQVRGRLKVERELLRLSGKDGQKWPAIQRSSGKQWRTTRWRPWKIIKDFMEVESGRKPDPSVLTATPMGEGA